MSKKLMTAKEIANEIGIDLNQIYYWLRKFKIIKIKQTEKGSKAIYYYDFDDLKKEIGTYYSIDQNDKYADIKRLCEITNLTEQVVRFRLLKFNLKHDYKLGAKYYYDKSIVEILNSFEYKCKKSFKSIRNVRFKKRRCLYCFKYYTDNYFPEGKSSVCYECREKISESVKANFVKLYHKKY